MNDFDMHAVQKDYVHSSGHTIRRKVGGPAPHREWTKTNHGRYSLHECQPFDQTREERVHIPRTIRDYRHPPQTKVYCCKLWEHQHNRQWLRRARRYENHSARADRDADVRQDVKELH